MPWRLNRQACHPRRCFNCRRVGKPPIMRCRWRPCRRSAASRCGACTGWSPPWRRPWPPVPPLPLLRPSPALPPHRRRRPRSPSRRGRS
ncbi:hypothetical protein DD559_17825 [Sphingomonas pokkalii]|uniref:Uncharacterized protein n=1 Tax=Sphingomonas pokkalii TaxID=2175090 RepID=A0A2U0SJW4_9SPHN|nr:hypothetical protein DD559_17825 [Sphingomonas pokkalii]